MKNFVLVGYRGALIGIENRPYLDDSGLANQQIEASYPVGERDGVAVTLAIVSDPLPEAYQPIQMRQVLAQAQDQTEYMLLSRAVQLVTWHSHHQFCGRCGTKTEHHVKDLAKHCPVCKLVHYPRISPCIIVLVVDGERCLLARSPHFPPGRLSTLAGFIEAGESAEAAVHREVREEVGIEVKNVRYMESQSWPFPHSLMLGFIADYDSGELAPDGIEIEEAHWFTRETLPDLPPSFAISYKLIERFIKGEV